MHEHYSRGKEKVEKLVENFQQWNKTRDEGFEEADANREAVGSRNHSDLVAWQTDMLSKRQATQSRRQAYLASRKVSEAAADEDSNGDEGEEGEETVSSGA